MSGARPRNPLRDLSTRGRAFVAAGLTAVACAVVLGQPVLVGAGVLAAALPLVALLVARASRFELHLRRSLTPDRVEVGQPAEVGLVLACEGRPPRRTLLLDDRVPYALGPRARMVLHGMTPDGRRAVTHVVRSEARGAHEVGPLRVHLRDAFGMVEMVREFSHTSTLTVRPRSQPLRAGSLVGGSGSSGEERPRQAAVGRAEDVTVREYRRGDDLRRVHWRATARTGELMVRREETPWQAHATVLLDNRAAAHRGAGGASSLEAAVALAASVTVHLCREGFTVHLVDADGTLVTGTADPGGDTALLDRLAVVRTSSRGDLAAFAEHDPHGERHVVVAVLGALEPADPAALRAAARRGTTTLAVVLDTRPWGDGADPEPDAEALGRRGWRATVLRAHEPHAAAWARLAARTPAGAPR